MSKKLFSALAGVSARQQRWRYLHAFQYLALCFAGSYYQVATASVNHATAISRTIIGHHDIMASYDDAAPIDHTSVMGYAIIGLPVLMAIHDGTAAKERTTPVAGMSKNVDSFENLNRKVHGFNKKFDQAIFKPAAKAYRFAMPKFLRKGATNFFRNAAEIPSTVNKLVQGKPRAVARGALRFLINSTLGVGGLFDVASRMRLKYEYEDFGQTLAVWGVGSGHYIVLPFFGPSTLRGGVGRIVETIISPFNIFSSFLAFNLIEQISVRGVELIGQRVALLSVEFVVTGDEYEFYRNAYLQRRDYLIHDGFPTTDVFLDDDF